MGVRISNVDVAELVNGHAVRDDHAREVGRTVVAYTTAGDCGDSPDARVCQRRLTAEGQRRQDHQSHNPWEHAQ